VIAAGVDPRLVERLEIEASRTPRIYRFKLTTLALAGDLALTVTQVLPLALPIVIGILWINVELFYWLGSAAVLFLAWVIRPTLRIDERELTREEAPRLHAELDRLRNELQVPGRMRVFLDASFNAGAAETRGWFGILGTQRALLLGIPLLAALSREQVLAVMAHEFGHFSRRHGRFGHWLYRARVGWNQYAQSVGDSDSALDRAAAWYARKFVPFFSARSFVHSRQCEYEADADAARVVGSRALADALTRTAVLGRLWAERLPLQMADWQAESPEPPRDYYERFVGAASQCPAQELRAWLDDAWREPSGWRDTHPSLSARLGALNEEARLVDAADSGGSALIGARWASLLEEFNRKWVATVRPDWLLEHLRCKHQLELPLGELRKRHAAQPEDKRLRFAYAAALLREGDESGVALMESIARAAPASRVRAFQRVVAHYERKGDARQVERWLEWLRQAARSRAEAVAAALDDMDAGRGRPSSVTVEERALMAEAVTSDPCLRKGWLLEAGAELRFAANRAPVPVVVHLLALAIDPEEAKRRDQDEEHFADRYEDLLNSLLPPDELAVVRTYFTTETIPGVYTEALRV
jgi:Zn-dependent protease with chaperone function